MKTITSSNKSIAVIPFVNISAEPENEYFSDGITEEIINALTSIRGLKVIARTSSFAYKGKSIDVRTIGKELGVQTILEGSVRKSQKKIRITAQLINTDDGSHFWSKNFDRNMQDIFALQDEVSLLIADQIRENFGHLEIRNHLVEAPDLEIDEYQHYLKGRHYLRKFNLTDIKSGISILNEVIKQKPDYALAHVSIHYAYNSMAAGGLMPVEEALSIGKKHLDKAVLLDDKLPECYHSLGWHSLNQNWDFKTAAKHLMKAIELRPGYADAHQKLFITLALEGKLEAAFEHIEIARQLDPLAVLNNYFTGYYYYLKQDFTKSNHYFEKTIEIEPSFIVGYSIYALSLVMQKRESHIFEVAEAIPDVDGSNTEKLILKTLAYSSLGAKEKANAGIENLRKILDHVQRERVRFFLIYIEYLLGNTSEALKLIETGVINHEPLMTLLKVDPLLKPLYKEDRFKKSLQKIYLLSDLSIPKEQKEKLSKMGIHEVNEHIKQLDYQITENVIYTDSDLSLKLLAEKINLHPNKLSWLLNEHIGKKFNEYINSYRITEFKRKALDPEYSNLTLLGLAYESGFNSKSVFNSYFKKTVGKTPKDWVKENRQ